MLVHTKLSDDPHVIADKALLTQLGPASPACLSSVIPSVNKACFRRKGFTDSLASTVRRLNPDVILLHWICNGFVRIPTLAKWHKPIVWTLQDMWPFTGGCHYSEDCDRYTQSCGACPQLDSHRQQDLSHRVWQRKFKAWQQLDLALVAPSSWMAKCAASSSLFSGVRIETIPFGLDTRVYKPIDKSTARDCCNYLKINPWRCLAPSPRPKISAKAFICSRLPCNISVSRHGKTDSRW